MIQRSKRTEVIVDSSSAVRQRYRRTKSEQQRLHAQAVQASLRMFDEGGYEAISMRKLASEVGVAPMSLYRYFPTKAHLIRHIWDDLLERAYHRAVEQLAVTGSPAARIAAYLDGYLQYWLDNRRHYWVVFAVRDHFSNGLADQPSEVLCPNPHRFVATLGDLIGECAGAPGRAEPQRKHLVEAVFCKTLGFLMGVIGVASLMSADIDGLKRRLVAEMVEQVMDPFENDDKRKASARSLA